MGTPTNALQADYVLEDYVIDSILGAGGFGITYKARDIQLNSWVAMKEYFPLEWACRGADGLSVLATAQGQTARIDEELSDYEWGLSRFLEEARVLAAIKHPHVVRVNRYFRAHGTAYIVMDYEEGAPLSELVADGQTLTEPQIRHILSQVLPALQIVHDSGYLHRDIKPSNLYQRSRDQGIMLIDFGAAREAVGRHSKSLTGLVSPGYSPPEQYSPVGGRYGCWTDIYALGATLYRWVSGSSPIDAPARFLGETLVPAVQIGAGRYHPALLQLIDRAMALRPEDRYQSVAQMQAELADAMSLEDDQDDATIIRPIRRTMSSHPKSGFVSTSSLSTKSLSKPSRSSLPSALPSAESIAATQPISGVPQGSPSTPVESESPTYITPETILQGSRRVVPTPKPKRFTQARWFTVAIGSGFVTFVLLIVWAGWMQPLDETGVEQALSPPPTPVGATPASPTALPTARFLPEDRAAPQLPATIPPPVASSAGVPNEPGTTENTAHSTAQQIPPTSEPTAMVSEQGKPAVESHAEPPDTQMRTTASPTTTSPTSEALPVANPPVAEAPVTDVPITDHAPVTHAPSPSTTEAGLPAEAMAPDRSDDSNISVLTAGAAAAAGAAALSAPSSPPPTTSVSKLPPAGQAAPSAMAAPTADTKPTARPRSARTERSATPPSNPERSAKTTTPTPRRSTQRATRSRSSSPQQPQRQVESSVPVYTPPRVVSPPRPSQPQSPQGYSSGFQDR